MESVRRKLTGLTRTFSKDFNRRKMSVWLTLGFHDVENRAQQSLERRALHSPRSLVWGVYHLLFPAGSWEMSGHGNDGIW